MRLVTAARWELYYRQFACRPSVQSLRSLSLTTAGASLMVVTSGVKGMALIRSLITDDTHLVLIFLSFHTFLLLTRVSTYRWYRLL